MDTVLSSLLVLGNAKVGGDIFCDGRIVYTSKTLGLASQTTHGLLSATDKFKLDSVAISADKNRPISDAVNSTSSTTDASSLAVKTAFDRAVTAETNAATYTDTKISQLINGAGSTLDTLQELANALNNDANFAVTVTNSIATKVSKSGDTMTGDLTINKSNAQLGLTSGALQLRLKITTAPMLEVVDGIVREMLKWNTTDKISELPEGARVRGKSQVTNGTHGYQWEVNANGELVLSKYQ